jgi:1-acyl-sn-glycerol-3-phosphate acyltransferase
MPSGWRLRAHAPIRNNKWGRIAGMTEDTGVTTELARIEDLREQLPGLEPERHLTDWGRSDRVEGLVDRTVYEFLYHYWFRVEVEGIYNVPEEGGALLLANHAGAMGAMIAKALREEHPRHRALHLAVDAAVHGWPGVGMLVTKVGGVAAHPANVHRLLFDEQQLVLAFPEGADGRRKPLRERYRLRAFGNTSVIESAIKARVPIVPVAVLGAEEAAPALVRLTRLTRLTRLARLPGVPPLPTIPLPAKFRIRFLEPVETDGLAWEDHGLVQSLGHDIQALIQENLLELVAGRRSVWLG